MRLIELDYDRDWLVIRIIGRGRESDSRQAKVKRVYLARDEAAMVVALLSAELGEVKTSDL